MQVQVAMDRTSICGQASLIWDVKLKFFKINPIYIDKTFNRVFDLNTLRPRKQNCCEYTKLFRI